ncbi:HD-GYP domain-containing protein [Thermosipho ferrireducens]|uniref:HD-GYP domain-containing protein n=1 Tax=Thermosipho ferrireducens TaxID=2571116 RepID=A0ABX7S6W9_9BACT|nr:HD-GYP domain-containing protein [Thermosipho ferrireducens]QTA37525.1 HD-GYP domain-containing protein [Thermosipho ferrireducens]
MIEKKRKILYIFLIAAVIITGFILYFLTKSEMAESATVFGSFIDNAFSNENFIVAQLDKNFFDSKLNRDLKNFLTVGANDYLVGIYYPVKTLKYVKPYKTGYLLYEIPETFLNLHPTGSKIYIITRGEKIVHSSDEELIGSSMEKFFMISARAKTRAGYTAIVGLRVGIFFVKWLLFSLPVVGLFLIMMYFMNNFYQFEKKLLTSVKLINRSLNESLKKLEEKREVSYVPENTTFEVVNELQEIIKKIFTSYSTILKEYKETNNILESTMAELEETYSELMERNIQIISALAEAIELKDAGTSNHSQNVMELSIMLAKELGVKDPTELEAIKYGSILHDIGKIGIPEYILNKTGKLSDEEFEIMKKHTIFGEKVIHTIPGWDLVADIVRHHHENIDGTGYPDGLSDGEISLRSQIVAIVDVFTALTEKRPYRGPLSIEKALEIIKNMVEKKFSRKVYEAFLKTLRKKGLFS